ncbi:MAG: hypothetical protein GXX79_15655 [Actinomycetales bacterium]|nr:hypothetical protein [Actinomycetales bacterium]
MDLIDYVRLIGRRWILVTVCVLVALSFSVTWAMLSPKQYTAKADVFVGSVVTSRGSTTAAQAASKFVLDRMESYAVLVHSPDVIRGVISQVGLATSEQALSGRVGASVPSGTVLLRISAVSADPQNAAAIANATAAQLSIRIEQLETPLGSTQPLVDVFIARPATPPVMPSSPNRPLIIGLGLVCGFGSGLLMAVIRDQALQRRPAAATGSQPAGDPFPKAKGSVESSPDRGPSVTAQPPEESYPSPPPGLLGAEPGGRDRWAENAGHRFPEPPARREEPAASYRREEPAASYRREEPAVSYRREEPAAPPRREEPAVSYRREEPAAPPRREEPAAPLRANDLFAPQQRPPVAPRDGSGPPRPTGPRRDGDADSHGDGSPSRPGEQPQAAPGTRGGSDAPGTRKEPKGPSPRN